MISVNLLGTRSTVVDLRAVSSAGAAIISERQRPAIHRERQRSRAILEIKPEILQLSAMNDFWSSIILKRWSLNVRHEGVVGLEKALRDSFEGKLLLTLHIHMRTVQLCFVDQRLNRPVVEHEPLAGHLGHRNFGDFFQCLLDSRDLP